MMVVMAVAMRAMDIGLNGRADPITAARPNITAGSGFNLPLISLLPPVRRGGLVKPVRGCHPIDNGTPLRQAVGLPPF